MYVPKNALHQYILAHTKRNLGHSDNHFRNKIPHLIFSYHVGDINDKAIE